MLNQQILDKMTPGEHREYDRLNEAFWQAYDELEFARRGLIDVRDSKQITILELTAIMELQVKNMREFETLMKHLHSPIN